jgi:SPASM domain peptide maturase of grasp-with-spasm system
MMTYRLLSTCLPVKGHLRSVIYDLHRNDYYFVPHDINKILADPEREVVFEPFIQKLLEAGIIFSDEINAQFDQAQGLDPDSYDFPSLITNSIIELDNTVDFEKIIVLLSDLNCFGVQFILFGTLDNPKDYFRKLGEGLKKSVIKHCELVLPYNLYLHFTELGFPGLFHELKYLFVYDAPPLKNITERTQFPLVYFDQDGFSYVRHQNSKSIHLFVINSLLFTESYRYNTYYNRKVFINLNGQVKNGPLTSYIHGNIHDPLFEVNNLPADEMFKQLWDIKKDLICVCNSCEFRYMCIDPRIPVKHLGNEWWYHDSECNYNPFIAKWSDENGYCSLADSGVTVTSEAITIDYTLLNRTINNIYGIEPENDQEPT